MAANTTNLLADIGGTNARFALLDAHGGMTKISHLPCAGFKTLEDAIAAYLDETGMTGKIETAALALAGPTEGDPVALTNNDWSFSPAALQSHLGFRALHLLNDFAALALAAPHLGSEDLCKIGQGKAVRAAPLAVLGPGTGLGVSGLIPDPSTNPPAHQKVWVPIAGEGGHVTLPPGNDKQSAVLAILRRDFSHVSAERVLSGPGLVTLGRALGEYLDAPFDATTPQGVMTTGLNGKCPVCRETLSMFCDFLGSVAADLALTLGARGGLYLGGGILPVMKDFLVASTFLDRFKAKGRFSNYLAEIPIFLVMAQTPAFIGLKQVLKNEKEAL